MTEHLGPHETEPRPSWAPSRATLGGHKAPKSERLTEALGGLELGAYDRRILDWLSSWENSTVEVIATWIERARDQGKATAGVRIQDVPVEESASLVTAAAALRGQPQAEGVYDEIAGHLEALHTRLWQERP